MEKIATIKKAYEIDFNKLDEGYLADTVFCHAESIGKAKTQLLSSIKYDDWKMKFSGEDVCFMNIPVKRSERLDKVLFEGKEVFRHDIESIIDERNRIEKLDEILNNESITHCYIVKGHYYRPDHCGYTSLRTEAGVYPKDEAVGHAKSVREIRLERIDISEHNKMITEKINELKGRLL